MINAGERIIVNNCRFGYLPNRVVFYLMNLHIKSRQTYFARAGVSTEEDSYKADASLCVEGESYSQRLCNALLQHRKKEREELIEQGGSDEKLKPLTVWTSTRRRTVQTAACLQEQGFKVKQRPQMSQLNPGDSEKMTEEQIKSQFHADWERHQLDPYHHRYPRGEVSDIGSSKSLLRIWSNNLIKTTRAITILLSGWSLLFSSLREKRTIF